MSDRKDFYFRQRVGEDELDAAFADLEVADHRLMGDLGFVGVHANAAVSPHAPISDLTVDVSGPGILYDQLGQRVFFSALQVVSVGSDDNGVPTAVTAAGKERVVSVYAVFARATSDPRIDGNSQTVFFKHDESFAFSVVQGAEGAAGAAVPPPLRADAILLADVLRHANQTQIGAADISITRRQDAFALNGAPRSIRRGRTVEVVGDLLGLYNAHVSGTADRHTAAVISYAGGPAWRDGGANGGTSVEAQLDKLVSDLAADAGAAKLGAAAVAGAPSSLPAGSVQAQLATLLNGLNAHQTVAPAHAATAIAYGGGPAWRDGSANGAATVEAQLDKLVTDLGMDAGATRIGAPARPAWLDGVANPPGSVFEALAKIVADLVAQVADADGAGRIGARASGRLSAGSVRSQLDELDLTSVRTDIAHVFGATQTLNGPASDVVAALLTTAAPTVRKLLWEAKGQACSYRIYAGAALELIANARWDGTRWVKDQAGRSTALRLSTTDLRVLADDGTTTPFDDVWANEVRFALTGKLQAFDAGGNWTSSGSTESYVGAFGSSNATICGAATTFRKVFPSTPSSFTFTVTQQVNVGSPVAFTPTPVGTGVFAAQTAGVSSATLFCRVVAS